MARATTLACLVLLAAARARGGEVSGRVEMPATCSPTISPAVVSLEPLDGRAPAPRGNPAQVALVRQSGLMFVPRVRAMTLGQPLRFTNEDRETHSVHNVGAGVRFSRSMKPGELVEIVPDKPGVIKLVCDVHSHMRAYVVVARSPWVATCGAEGRFRFRGVPEGRYTLRVWHEVGEPLVQEVEVSGGARDLGTLTVSGPVSARAALALGRARRWPEVIDRVGVLLAESLEVAGRADGAKRARRLAEDAYFAEFEASGMETAVRGHLGFERAGAIERRFLAVRSAAGDLAKGRISRAEAGRVQRALMADLVTAAGELNRMGVVDGAAAVATMNVQARTGQTAVGDGRAELAALDEALGRVRDLADRGEPDEAASAMADAYFAFEPLEPTILAVDPPAVPRLEARFNALRGKVGAGLKGSDLAAQLASLRGSIAGDLGRTATSALGAFGAAFGASLVTILREGIEVILLLTMLIALVAKTGRSRDLAAIRWGIGLAAAASLLTAVGLGVLMASAQGRVREQLEGGVMLAAAAILFYVSYWLVSQSQAQRWMDFLKQNLRHGAELGSAWTLGATAFLAVYREGAETALMYRALYDVQTSPAGQAGLFVGVGLGLLLLTGVYILLRSASVRLPLRPFFQVSGLVLFGMAVVFAGQGVAALQVSGLIKVTPLRRLGDGLPALGLYPNVQVVSVQGLLLAGAALAVALLFLDRGEPSPDRGPSRPARGAAPEGLRRDEARAATAPEAAPADLVEVARG